MRLPLDDQQAFHHAMGTLADMVRILLDEFERCSVPEELSQQMALIWWTSLCEKLTDGE
ncbi:MAG: hypothetical protein KatS3mg015_2533 [Fimbriimonadales bacterium]|nr:MAG: hypothetical protein KatS3mg015_2533 [Fimbriimonadales bacterium]